MSHTLESPVPASPDAPDRPPYVESKRKYQHTSHVVPRLQWNADSGYCGETSFICAGLSFGQYCSQYTARELASPGMNQRNPASQLLLGVNDMQAALRMRLMASEYDSGTHFSPPELIVWAKSHLLAGHVPIIGVLNNVYTLNEWPQNQGDGTYDHIVPVVGFASNESLVENPCGYFPTDVITFSDNGLWGPYPDGSYQFLYHYEVAGFQTAPSQVYSRSGPLYGLLNTPPNYGIAIEGVLDLDGVCIPVYLSNPDQEPPTKDVPLTEPLLPDEVVIVPELDKYYRRVVDPMPIRLTATVSLPDPGKAYNLYLYEDFDKVPVAGFNAAAGNAKQVWHIPTGSDPTFKVHHAAMSNETVAFRAVPASAP
jgi:hypothetical protein